MRFGLVMLIVIVVLQVPANGHGESQKTGCTNYVTDNRGSQNYEPAVEHPHLTRLVRHIYPDLCEGLVGQGRLLVVSILHPNLRLLRLQGIHICMDLIKNSYSMMTFLAWDDLTPHRNWQIFVRKFTHSLHAKGQLAGNCGDFGRELS